MIKLKYYKAFIRINNGNWVDMIITAKRKKDVYDIVENFYMKLNYIFRNIFNFNLIVEEVIYNNGNYYFKEKRLNK